VKQAATLALFTALALVPGAQAKSQATVLAVLSTGVTAELVRVDPRTLRIEGRRLSLARHALPWTRSPDGSRVAIGGARSIRLVDVRAWQRHRDVRLRGTLVALAWPEPRRLLAILAGRCCPQRLRAVVFDPATGKPTVQRPDGGFGSGSYRRAAWIARDLVAVAGWNDRVVGKGTRRRQESQPAGLLLIDVRTLTIRTVEPRATFFTRVGRLLLVPEGSRGGGLSAYGFDGLRRFRSPRLTAVGELPSAGRFTYVGLSDQYRTHPVRVLDLTSGRVVRTVSVPGMLTLLTEAAPRVCRC
jgi:hypothetical protein